jgi:sugar O-acyltransferase (sialic acid O-acetyltransferase NeuD family)
MNRIGIFGTSGMAREAGDIAWALGLEPVYVSDIAHHMDPWPYPGEVIPEERVGEYSGMPYVIGIADGAVRERIAQRFRGILRFTNLIHPDASLGRGQGEAIDTAQGVLVCAGARLTSSIQVGDFAIVNQNACVAHDVIIGPYVHVAPGACVSGNVHLGARCWIGAGAVINQGDAMRKRMIGADAVVGSGAVVLDDCAPNGTYVGVPARRIA